MQWGVAALCIAEQSSGAAMPRKLSIRKTRRLRPLLAKAYPLPEPPDEKETLVDRVVMAVLWAPPVAGNGLPVPAKARQAYARLAEEFVDWNELRVSMTSEAGAVLEACGLSPVKAVALKRILSKAVAELYCFDFEALAARPREQLKAWFMSIEGLPHPIAASVLYHVFDYDRVLVDGDIARVIRRLGLVGEAATEAEVEAGLAEVIPAREAQLIYHGLRQHALTVCTPEKFNCRACLLRKECKTGEERIAALEAAAREARQKAKALAKAKAAARAKAGTRVRPKQARPRSARKH